MKTVYLVRHGETLFNVMEKNQGQCDSPLTEKGIRQAQAAAAWFRARNISFGEVYCSTSERACDTAEIISGGMPYTRCKGLREIALGTKEASPTSENPTYPYGDFFIPYGGEGLDAVTARICRTMEEITRNSQKNPVLVVSHGVAIRRFLETLLSPEQCGRRVLGNCGIVCLSWQDDTFTVDRIVDPNGRS